MLVIGLISHDVLQQINMFRPKSTKIIAAIIVVLLDSFLVLRISGFSPLALSWSNFFFDFSNRWCPTGLRLSRRRSLFYSLSLDFRR